MYSGECEHTNNNSINVIKIKLEEGNKSTSWCPALEDNDQENLNNKTIIQLPQPLRSLSNDIRDRIIKKDGIWGVLREIGVMLIDSATITEILNNYNNIKYISIPKPSLSMSYGNNKGLLLCTTLKYTDRPMDWNWDNSSFIGTINSIADKYTFRIGVDKNCNISEIKTLLHNSKIYYELQTPVFEPFTSEMQNILNNLKTYTGRTIIYTTDKLNPDITLNYIRNVDIIGYIQSKYNTLIDTIKNQEILINNLKEEIELLKKQINPTI